MYTYIYTDQENRVLTTRVTVTPTCTSNVQHAYFLITYTNSVA